MHKLIAPVDVHNHRAVNLVGKLGFVAEATISGYYGPDRDVTFHTMTREQCRWL